MKKYIPSVITSGNLICGFAAIQIGDFYWSPILLLCSFVFDGKTNYLLTPLFLSIMMVSFGLRMFSTKGLTKQWKDNIYHYIMAVVAIIIAVIFKYESVSYIVLAYIVLSIINTLTSKYREKMSN
ncbi:MAG: hypothetical protein IPO92_18280 [Saprospiraceae bacterium]|nr:hypothetical protein [Saprospiraceae bacterium]